MVREVAGPQHHIEERQLTRGNGNTAQQLAELLIIAHSQLDVAGNDPGLLVVACSIASKLEDLSCQVLQDCDSEAYWDAAWTVHSRQQILRLFTRG